MSYQFRKIFLEQSGNMALLKKQLHEDFLQSSLKIQPFIRGITAESNRPSSQKILAFSRQQLIETRFCLKKRSISQISSGSC
jgi:hypothetical protein